MNNDPKKSAQPCGCDEGANYICERHTPPQDWPFVKDDGESLKPSAFEAAMTCWCGGRSKHVPGPNCVYRPVPSVARDEKRWRKERPLYSGVLAYFPDALMEVAYVSYIGNFQHNGDTPLRWAREKSTDHLDCCARHITDHSKNPVDTDGAYHLAKNAWRALAELQTFLEKERA